MQQVGHAFGGLSVFGVCCVLVGTTACPADLELNRDQFACGSGGPCAPDPSPSPSPDAGPRCTSDDACPAGRSHCEPRTQTCLECLQSSHCAGSMICFEGRCSARPPSRDGGMPACLIDDECGPPARICHGGACVLGCAELGGLQCLAGTVCNPTTGRCTPAGGCSADGECGPPATVCEGRACVAGCAEPAGLACGVAQVCDTRTGRCVAVSGPCMNDVECSPPQQICETGQCVPGCAQVGGVQCTGNTTCTPATGRCVMQGGSACTSDVQCAPPGTVCNLTTSMCNPGCGAAGCGAGETCNSTTGHCDATLVRLPLDAVCAANGDCVSSVCFDLGGMTGKRCVQSCGSSGDCPAQFTCYDFAGGNMCLSHTLFSGATFTGGAGASCASSGQCHSNYCRRSDQICQQTCTTTADCSSGLCQWNEIVQHEFLATCVTTGTSTRTPDGASCAQDDECQSGACLSNKCQPLCASTSDCADGSTCVLADYSACTLELIGSCLAYRPNFVSVCAVQMHGADPIGAPCSGFESCRSGLCHTGLGQCTDLCASDGSCPASHRCKVLEYGQLSDGTKVYINVCLPESF